MPTILRLIIKAIDIAQSCQKSLEQDNFNFVHLYLKKNTYGLPVFSVPILIVVSF